MKTIYLFLVLSFVLVSCSDDEENESSNFYALKTGNSWLYKYYSKDLTTNEFSELKATEEVSIVSTEEVRGNIYYKFKYIVTHDVENPSNFYPREGIKFNSVRDSIGFLISSTGKIIYSNNDDNNELFLYQSVIDFIDIYGKFNSINEEVNVEAGTFVCTEFVRFGRDVIATENLPLGAYDYYAEGIGFIHKEESYLSSGIKYIEKRLNFYNVQ